MIIPDKNSHPIPSRQLFKKNLNALLFYLTPNESQNSLQTLYDNN